MIGRWIDFSARHRAAVLLVYAFVAALSVLAMRRVPLDAIPDLSDPQVIVFTEWSGRSPTLVEDQVTFPISSSLLAAPKVTAVRAYSMLGMSFVHVLFEEGTDVYWARSRVLEYLSSIQAKLPSGVTPTLGPDASGVGWVYEYALTDVSKQHDLSELRRLQDYTLRYAIESVPGVAQVASVGGYQRQYQVELDPERLRAYGLTFSDVAERVRGASAEVSGRVLEMSGREYAIRGRGYVGSTADLEAVVVAAAPGGVPVRVRDVGSVKLGAELRRGLAELDGMGETVGAIVMVRHGENALSVIERVKERLRGLEKGLPEGVRIVPTYDRSSLIERAIATLTRTLKEEIAVVSVVIIVFLLHLRSALLPIISLPLAVAMAFIPMLLFDVPATIMSLGGIAIAIGATVDAEIVMLEACHKRLESAPANLTRSERAKLLGEAAKEVTPAIFFSLLIIAISFLPVFALNGQAGRLFRPLAYTKTFVMLAAALLSVTLAPALRDLLLRGKIRSEAQHPVSRAIRAVYEPFVHVALRRPITTLAIGAFAMLSAVPLALRLGREFMPPLDEGDLLYMPTTLPGISIEEAKRQLIRQDQLIAAFPEVSRVFGKVGRAETATDPAPLSMVETIVQLRPREQWPKVPVQRFYSDWASPSMQRPFRWLLPDTRSSTRDELIAKLNSALALPGWTNAWTMPIKTRIDMLTTGVRTPVGIKVLGPSLESIESVGAELERVISRVPGTRSVLYERALGGSYLDIEPRRDDLARYNLGVEDLHQVVEGAVGGEPVGFTVEGRGRFSINVRLQQDFRSDPSALAALYVRAPDAAGGAAVRVSDVADVRVQSGPPMLRSEAGRLAGYVYVDVLPTRDLESYVTEAQMRVAAAEERGELRRGTGVELVWTGEYELYQQMKERMQYLIPLALLLVALLLYLQFRNLVEVAIVFLSIPFALVGSVWLLYLLDYRISTAVWVGVIALVGLAAQTGVVMIVYIDQAFFRRLREGRIQSRADIIEAHSEGTVQRVRPKLMTVGTMLIGLLPLMWATGSGADVMKRIAAPLIGGLLSSAFLTLELIPVIYTYWRAAQLRRAQRSGKPLAEICGLTER
ncbi:MAG TPA: efflux RND transporter permease subunit [Polyangiaceae bacterium]|nr:efflux RND transporter permease subunit [Polyangiaceae bacterium]